MTQPELLFVMQVNKARHDRMFQRFLAQSFGERGIFTEDGNAIVAYHWRGITYVTKVITGLPK